MDGLILKIKPEKNMKDQHLLLKNSTSVKISDSVVEVKDSIHVMFPYLLFC